MSFKTKRTTGECKKFNLKKGFGFITCDDVDGDIFVHKTEIITGDQKLIKKGDIVQFNLIVTHDGKRKATRVIKLGQKTNNDIRKIGKNQSVSYGDGGECYMKWDIYMHDNLRMDKKIVSLLKTQLIQLGATNNDWRENEPIQNIIDPDLYVYKFYDKELYWLSNKHKQDYYQNEVRSWLRDDHKEDGLPETCWKEIQQKDEKGYFIRRRYQWLATEMKENDDCTVSICSAIHNISPRSKFASIYEGIEYIFGKMLPLFNKFEVFNNRKQKQFQVIVKSQRYEIEDMSGYKGHWHKEGLTENIVIVGLYYFEKNEGIKGGNLRFRNIKQPEDHYAEHCYPKGAQVVHEAQIEEGSAIAFDNIHLVHRVRLLKNKIGDKKKRYRSFLAFFIVDPDKRIKSTKDVASCKREIFMKVIAQNTMLESQDIISLICEYSACGYTWSEAQNIRKLNIEVRKNPTMKGKWATCNFGNCGDQIWFENGKIYPTDHMYNDDVYWKDTTHSEL